jgi:hypothetical protein
VDGHGGFMASNCILKGTMYLKWLSVAPVTMEVLRLYTSRTCKNPEKSGYDEIHQLIM